MIDPSEHTKLVYFKANRVQECYAGSDEFDDLVGVGNVALCKAARRFDPSKGYKFSTYALRSIGNAMFKYMCYNRKLTSPPYSMGRFLSIINRFKLKEGRDPTIEEMRALIKRKIAKESTYKEYLYRARIFSAQVFYAGTVPPGRRLDGSKVNCYASTIGERDKRSEYQYNFGGD